jgi:hypothetical protein
MLKCIRHRYNANFRIMVIKHAEQITVKHKKIAFLGQISKGGDEKEKLKNVKFYVTSVVYLFCHSVHATLLNATSIRNLRPAQAGFSLLHVVQTGSGVHPTSYPMGTTGSFPRGTAARA